MESIRRIVELCKKKKSWLKLLDQKETEKLYAYIEYRYMDCVFTELIRNVKPGDSKVTADCLIPTEDFIDDYKDIYLKANKGLVSIVDNTVQPKKLMFDNSKLTADIAFKDIADGETIALNVGNKKQLIYKLSIPNNGKFTGFDKAIVDVLASFGNELGYPYNVTVNQIHKMLQDTKKDATPKQKLEIVDSIRKCNRSELELTSSDKTYEYTGSLIDARTARKGLVNGQVTQNIIRVLAHPLIDKALLSNQVLTMDRSINKLTGTRQDVQTITIREYVKRQIVAHKDYLKNANPKKRKQNFNVITMTSLYKMLNIDSSNKKATQKARTKLFNVLDSYKQDKHINNYKIEGKHPIKSVTFYLQI